MGEKPGRQIIDRDHFGKSVATEPGRKGVQPRVVDQDVDVVVTQSNLAPDLGDRSQIVEITEYEIDLGVRRGGPDQIQSSGRPPFVAGGQHETRAVPSQINGGELAETAGGSCDDDCLTLRRHLSLQIIDKYPLLG